MNYNLNIIRLIEDALPSFIRGARQTAWLSLLTKPVDDLNQTFLSFTDKANERMKWNGQTISLLHLLWDRYDSGIQITNNNLTARPFYLYGSGDGRNPKVYDTGNKLNPVVDEINAFDATAVDFVITLPGSIDLGNTEEEERALEEMAALVKEYKLYGKRFKINKLT